MKILDSPSGVFIVSFVVLWLSGYLGHFLRGRVRVLQGEKRDDLGVALTATLTLLGLLIGFTFAMAISRYDLRKACEENETNAIGTEFLRADVLPAPDAGQLRTLLKAYLEKRVSFYVTRDRSQLTQIAQERARLQMTMWALVRATPERPANPGTALAMAGMNDVINTQRLTAAAWHNRIPVSAWLLMTAIGICCSLLFGYRVHKRDWRMFLAMPVAVGIAFLMIADIDSPRAGAVQVAPENLETLRQFMSMP